MRRAVLPAPAHVLSGPERVQRHLKVLEGVLDAFSKMDTGEIITCCAEKAAVAFWPSAGHQPLGPLLLCRLLGQQGCIHTGQQPFIALQRDTSNILCQMSRRPGTLSSSSSQSALRRCGRRCMPASIAPGEACFWLHSHLRLCCTACLLAHAAPIPALPCKVSDS